MRSQISVYDTIENQDFSTTGLDAGRYENHEFKNCIFTDISGIDFTDCVFRNCNLSNVKFNNCKLDKVEFFDCKLLGVNFSQSKDFGFEVHFFNCNMDYTSFDKKKMNKSQFDNCQLVESNFTQADLSKCKLNNCNFQSALFAKTNLTAVDFRTCSNFLIDPTDNFIKKAKFRSQDLAGLLYRFDIVIS